jgi:hypothetical protein
VKSGIIGSKPTRETKILQKNEKKYYTVKKNLQLIKKTAIKKPPLSLMVLDK